MKITDFAILFVIILLPFFIINGIHVDAQKQVMNMQLRYNHALDTAVQDAAKALTFNADQEYEAGYKSDKKYRANKEEAIQTFFRTMYTNFDVLGDPMGEQALQSYVPVVVVIDYDGYYVYAVDYGDNRNDPRSPDYDKNSPLKPNWKVSAQHVWSPKKPYAYVDSQHNSVSFTLDDYVVAYDAASKKWVEGRRADVASQVNIPILNDPAAFNQVRRSTIVREIQSDLEYYINSYNQLSRKLGTAYTFTLPSISNEEWNNSIDDIGIMAFVQGIPMGDQYYNNYSLGGARIYKKDTYYGATTINGVKYYYSSKCNVGYTPQEKFDSAKEAASHGYHPLECVNGATLPAP